MTLKDLIDFTRRRLDDTKTPQLWKNPDLILFLNDAEQEAARRARILVDSRTTEVCELAVVVGESYLELDPRILFVRRAKLATQDYYLPKLDVRDLDEQRPGWEAETGDVYGWIQNVDSTRIRLVAEPDTADTMNLTVVRLPLVDMAADTDEPEIRKHLHLSLAYWALYRAFSDPNVDTYDETKAVANLALFEREFGKPSTAIDEQWLREQTGYDSLEGART